MLIFGTSDGLEYDQLMLIRHNQVNVSCEFFLFPHELPERTLGVLLRVELERFLPDELLPETDGVEL